MTKKKRLAGLLFLVLSLTHHVQGFAQGAGGGGGGSSGSLTSSVSGDNMREAIGLIMLSGLVGGVFGLSTLSFYEKPQDHIKNITYGAGVGVIVMSLYLTFSVATTPVSPTAFVLPYFDLDSGVYGAQTSLRF